MVKGTVTSDYCCRYCKYQYNVYLLAFFFTNILGHKTIATRFSPSRNSANALQKKTATNSEPRSKHFNHNSPGTHINP